MGYNIMATRETYAERDRDYKNRCSGCQAATQPVIAQLVGARSPHLQSVVAFVCFAVSFLALTVATATAAEVDSEEGDQMSKDATVERTFGEDVEFLKSHLRTFVLTSAEGDARVAIVPAYQGRVMTSTADGPEGTSFGWINYELVASGVEEKHINAYGGEERFWLGPEGGQFSLYFKHGADFEFSDWQTPAVIDTEPYDVAEGDDTKVVFHRSTSLQNYSGFTFDFDIERTISLLSANEASESLGCDFHGLNYVGYRTTNSLTNTGDKDWKKETGLLSIWLLGMYKPGPNTTIVVPFRKGDEAELGPIVNDAYFGKVPAERLIVDDGVLFMSGDGEYRSKIGVSPCRSLGISGSYDAKRGVLTLVKYNQPGPDVTDYVNSMWELQEHPYAGDAINAYNDGVPAPGAEPLGPFYEIETSSPALALKKGTSGVHIQETYHVLGTREQLNRLAQKLLGVSLQQITSAL